MAGEGVISRRGFLGRVLRGTSIAAGFWLYGLPALAGEMTPRERASLDAVLDTLVPDDEYPGALRAGVPQRIEVLVAENPRRARLYRRGLAALESRSRRATGRSFQELSPDERGEVLAGLQGGFGPGPIFFHYVRRDAMTAYYSTPEAYEMLGYEPPLNGYAYTPVAPEDRRDAHG